MEDEDGDDTMRPAAEKPSTAGMGSDGGGLRRQAVVSCRDRGSSADTNRGGGPGRENSVLMCEDQRRILDALSWVWPGAAEEEEEEEESVDGR